MSTAAVIRTSTFTHNDVTQSQLHLSLDHLLRRVGGGSGQDPAAGSAAAIMPIVTG